MLANNKNFPVNSGNVLYRHGDVLIKGIASIPKSVQKQQGVILAHGEVTGHSHRIQPADAVQLWVHGNELFLEVKQTGATLVHEEHRAIALPQGLYRVWRQREYRPNAYVEVED
ncbi:hypothetical protein NIES2100_44080 [Calothrix sp. NIES-2100]|uniref:hypothetical protein n=1 Tax=Calothrix sp. NIES-2100 TaxID=1954172 RepID=UPI000B5FC5F9|nr:hypothetical protein NIES2100_44080 [Calothrix sp. NIES-2100]